MVRLEGQENEISSKPTYRGPRKYNKQKSVNIKSPTTIEVVANA